jgi:hypothetical protein
MANGLQPLADLCMDVSYADEVAIARFNLNVRN